MVSLLQRLCSSWQKNLPDYYGTFVVGCFDDTGVWDLLDKVRRPVIGIGQAAYHWASLFRNDLWS